MIRAVISAANAIAEHAAGASISARKHMALLLKELLLQLMICHEDVVQMIL